MRNKIFDCAIGNLYVNCLALLRSAFEDPHSTCEYYNAVLFSSKSTIVLS